MENKANDTPKVIGLSVAIVIALLFFVWRYLSATQTEAPRAAVSGETAVSSSDAIPNATTASVTTATPKNDGLMRDVTDTTLDPDQPVRLTSAGRTSSVFQQIKVPTQTAFVWPDAPKIHIIPNPGRSGHVTPPVYVSPPAAQPLGHWENLPPLEVRLDGVYEIGSERVSELTMRDTGVKDATPQTVYRRVGEPIGPFKIAGITSAGIRLSGRGGQWAVGDTAMVSQGQRWVVQLPASPVSPTNSSVQPAILLPNR